MSELLTPWLPAAPLLFVVVAGVLLMIVDSFVADWEKAFDPRISEVSIVGAMIFFLAVPISLGLWDDLETPRTIEFVRGYLAFDRFALFIDATVATGAGLACLLAGGYLTEHRIERGEFYVLTLFSSVGAMLLGHAADLLAVFVALETLSLGVYGMVAFRRHSPKSAEAAMKYFLLGSFASAILLFGMALLYGATGSTRLTAIGEAVAAGTADIRLLTIGTMMLVVGLAFKVSAVPFHMWTPDAYEGAPTPTTTFMSVVVKAGCFAVLTRILFVALGSNTFSSSASGWPTALAALAGITMVVGNVAAVAQKNIKRMLAYSSIGHAGFILLGVCATFKLGDTSQLSSVLYYLLAYTVSSILAFGSLIWAGSRGKEVTSLEDIAGLGRRNPLLGLAFTLGVLSLMGFPPTAGFFAKYYVLSAAVSAGGWFLWLSVIGVLASAVAAYYYLRVLVYLYMREPEKDAAVAVPMRSISVATTLVIASYLVLRMGISPGPYLQYAIEAAASLAA